MTQTAHESHLFKAITVLVLIVLVLFGKALLTSDVLAQTDILWTLAPWNENRPADFIQPKNPLLSDQTYEVIPYLYYLKRAASEGRIPLWNPHIMTGMPFLANMQSAVLFPPYWLALLMPVPDALEWICAIKFLLCALGFYLFCLKALEVRPLPAFSAAVIYALCGFNTVWLFYAHTNVTLLVGWLLLAVHGVLVRGEIRRLLLLGTLVALTIVAGHPETALHVLVIVAIFAAVRIRRSPASTPAAALRLGGAGVLGAALAAVVLLPFAADSFDSATLAIRKVVGHASLPLLSTAVALIPNCFGSPTAGFYGGPQNYNEIASFSSVSALALAGIALVFARRHPGTRFGLAVLVLCGLVAYGVPPVFQGFHLLPLYRYSINSRMVLGVSLGLATLAAIGLDTLYTIEDERRRRQIRLWIALCATAAIALLSRFGAHVFLLIRHDRPKLVYLSAETAWFLATVLTLIGLLTWLIRSPARRGRVCFFFTLLICLEMVRFSFAYNPTIPRSHYAYDYVPGSVQFLQSRGIDRFAGVNFGELASNSSMVYGIFDFRGYDFPEPLLYGEYFYTLVDGSNLLNITHSISRWTPGAVRALGNAGVRYFVHDGEIDYPGMRLVHSSGLKIYEYERALPRAFIPHRTAAVAGNQEALRRMQDPQFDARETTLVTTGGGEPALPRTSPEEAHVEIVSYQAERVRLRAETPAPAVVVLTDTASQGWQARVNGAPAAIYTANGLFRAVAVPPGTSSIEFEYRPRGYVIGRIMSLATLLGIVLVWGWSVLRRA